MSHVPASLRLVRSSLVAAALCLGAFAANASALILGAPNVSGQAGLVDIQTKIAATGLIHGSVDIFDVGNATPALDFLKNYDAVLVFSDRFYASATLLGNVLADFVDAGGGVVEAGLSHFSVGLRGLSGRFVSGNYDVYNSTLNQIACGTLGTVAQPNSPLMAGIDSLDASTGNCNRLTLKTGSQLVASWSTGQPLAAYRLDHNAPVVGLNFYPVSGDASPGQWNPTTDGALLMANALAFVSPARSNDVPEPGSLALLGIAGVAAFAARRRRQGR